MMNAELRLELNHIALEYGSRQVLTGIDLLLRVGETLVVAGANGSGKSSLLRVMCGLQKPSSGSVRIHSAAGWHTPAAAPWMVGWVAPDLQLYRELTALENLRFFAQVRGLYLSDAQIEDVLTDIGLQGRGGDLLAAYSSGMAQRLRYAFALLHQPPILLLDEPTVTLDERGAALVQQIVERQRQRGITVIATNDPRELRFGDYILRLDGATAST